MRTIINRDKERISLYISNDIISPWLDYTRDSTFTIAKLIRQSVNNFIQKHSLSDDHIFSIVNPKQISQTLMKYLITIKDYSNFLIDNHREKFSSHTFYAIRNLVSLLQNEILNIKLLEKDISLEEKEEVVLTFPLEYDNGYIKNVNSGKRRISLYLPIDLIADLLDYTKKYDDTSFVKLIIRSVDEFIQENSGSVDNISHILKKSLINIKDHSKLLLEMYKEKYHSKSFLEIYEGKFSTRMVETIKKVLKQSSLLEKKILNINTLTFDDLKNLNVENLNEEELSDLILNNPKILCNYKFQWFIAGKNNLIFHKSFQEAILKIFTRYKKKCEWVANELLGKIADKGIDDDKRSDLMELIWKIGVALES